eukprot:TRINITY_DN60537_c0_g1_i1.p1 TRINITY_DN60537_c0_g1~~TRINITY_DN60537_c0_g1_i1.p1  ORF type:complete len:554 (+),score=62.51 TRINITY_DN60537_c0_g1_i1:17-1678(+)
MTSSLTFCVCAVLFAQIYCASHLQVIFGSTCAPNQIIARSGLALELEARGHEVIWAIPTPCELTQEMPGSRRDIGVAQQIPSQSDPYDAMANTLPRSFAASMDMITGTRELIKARKTRGPVVVLSDLFTPGVCIAAELEGVVCVRDLLTFVPFLTGGVDASWRFPSFLTPKAFRDFTFTDRIAAFVSSFMQPYYLAPALQVVNAEREKFGLPALSSLAQSDVTFIHTAPPMVQQSLPANQFLIGAEPILEEGNKELEELLGSWLNDGAPVLFVHLEHPTAASGQEWLSVLDQLAYLSYRVLWVYPHLSTLGQVPQYIKVVQKAPTQFILNHPNILALVTNGDYNALVTALFGGKASVIIPTNPIQRANARVIHSLGCGYTVPESMDEITDDVTNLKAYLVDVIDERPKWFKRNVEKVAKYVSLPGGSKRGVDILEKLGQIENRDIGFMQNPLHEVNLLEANGVDVVVVLFGVLPALLVWSVCWCCDKCCPEGEEPPKPKLKPKPKPDAAKKDQKEKEKEETPAKEAAKKKKEEPVSPKQKEGSDGLKKRRGKK